MSLCELAWVMAKGRARADDPLPRLSSVVDWQSLQPLLKVIHRETAQRTIQKQ